MTTPRTEAGFALILALLTLLVLTFLGLALATTTTTELQIGYNYKWNHQAYYNAQAGLELAKRFLRQQTWSVLLPQARDVAGMSSLPTWSLARTDPSGQPSRNWENSDCDLLASGGQGVGYGVVLDLDTMASPFQNVTSFLGENLGGAFTVWVRRPLHVKLDGTVEDEKSDASAVVTAEGVAPYFGAMAGGSLGQRNKAVRILEVELQKVDPGDCENDFTGQTGMGALGANYDPCSPVSPEGVPNATAEINPNQ